MSASGGPQADIATFDNRIRLTFDTHHISQGAVSGVQILTEQRTKKQMVRACIRWRKRAGSDQRISNETNH